MRARLQKGARLFGIRSCQRATEAECGQERKFVTTFQFPVSETVDLHGPPGHLQH